MCRWDDHYYRTPDVMASLGSVYDEYNRSLPRVFVGEFAANSPGEDTPTLRAALAEGIFMLGFERNADVVAAASFAPLLNNVKGTQWAYNLLNCNASHQFVLPSYHAQVLLSHARGTHTLPTSLTPPYAPHARGVLATAAGRVVEGEGVRDAAEQLDRALDDSYTDGTDAEAVVEEDEALDGVRPPPPPPPPRWLAAASLGGTDGSLVAIKMVNYGEAPRPVDVEWGGAKPLGRITDAQVLTADSPDAVNTLDQPAAVAPAPLEPAPTIVSGGKGMKLELPAWSLVTVTVALG